MYNEYPITTKACKVTSAINFTHSDQNESSF